jgi:hypothetical protein
MAGGFLDDFQSSRSTAVPREGLDPFKAPLTTFPVNVPVCSKSNHAIRHVLGPEWIKIEAGVFRRFRQGCGPGAGYRNAGSPGLKDSHTETFLY